METENTFIEKQDIWKIFSGNWVFLLYSKTRDSFPKTLLRGILVSLGPWFLGALFFLIQGEFSVYVTNVSLYLNILGFLVALISFGWFAYKLPSLLLNILPAFYITKGDFEQTIMKWARRFGVVGFYILMPLLFLFFFWLNYQETVEFWTPGKTPPVLLKDWVESNSSSYFMYFYGLLHAIITPFLLASGAIGLLGTVLLFSDILSRRIRISYYRRLGEIVEFDTWLIMFTLIALGSVALFGRPSMILLLGYLLRGDLSSAKQSFLITSGISQSLVVLILLLFLSIPLLGVHNVIIRAKREKLNVLETQYDRIYTQLENQLAATEQKGAESQHKTPKGAPQKGDISSEPLLERLNERLQVTYTLIKQIEEIPTLPFSIPSFLRVIIGSLVYISSFVFRLSQEMRVIEVK